MERRNLLILVVLLFLGQEINAQREFSTSEAKLYSNEHQGLNLNARATDVVLYPTADDDCSRQVTIFGFTDAWGAVSGNNEYGDREKAQLLEYSGSAVFNVIGAGTFFDSSAIVNDGLVRAKVYSSSGAGSPQDLLATSTDIKVSALVPPTDTSIEITAFTFEEVQPEIISGRFFISIDVSSLYESEDTVGLFHTQDNCGVGTNTWELYADNTWHTVSEFDLNVDWLIVGIIEFDDNTTSDQYVTHNGLQLFASSPNPAVDHTVLHYAIDDASSVNIEVYDAAGKRVRQLWHDTQRAGRYSQQINTSDLVSGTYLYRISTNQGHLMSRFVVQR